MSASEPEGGQLRCSRVGIPATRESKTTSRAGSPAGRGSPHLLCPGGGRDRKSTRLNSSHLGISYAVFCLKKKMKAESKANADLAGVLAFHWRAAGKPDRELPHLVAAGKHADSRVGLPETLRCFQHSLAII